MRLVRVMQRYEEDNKIEDITLNFSDGQSETVNLIVFLYRLEQVESFTFVVLKVNDCMMKVHHIL